MPQNHQYKLLIHGGERLFEAADITELTTLFSSQLTSLISYNKEPSSTTVF
jgi:hypothetical protein